METLPIEALIILASIAVVLVLWLVLRWGRYIIKVILVLGILAVVVLGMGALFSQATANRATAQAALETARMAKAASIGQSIGTVIGALLIGAMATVTVGALAVAGYFALRWKLEQRKAALPGHRPQALPKMVKPGAVVYVLDEGEPIPLDVDLEEWGW